MSVFARASDDRALGSVKTRMEDCFEAGALAAGCRADISWAEADYLDMNINHTLADIFEDHARSMGRDFTPYENIPLAGTDMSNVSRRVPTLHPLLACAPSDVMIHDARFTEWAAADEADSAIIDGTKCLTMTAIDFLCDESIRGRATEEFVLSGAFMPEPSVGRSGSDRRASAGCGCEESN